LTARRAHRPLAPGHGAGDRGAHGILDADDPHPLAGAGDRHVQQLAGEQRRLRGRQHDRDAAELAALCAMDGHGVHGGDLRLVLVLHAVHRRLVSRTG
jgi:hypothetical protein